MLYHLIVCRVDAEGDWINRFAEGQRLWVLENGFEDLVLEALEPVCQLVALVLTRPKRVGLHGVRGLLEKERKNLEKFHENVNGY